MKRFGVAVVFLLVILSVCSCRNYVEVVHPEGDEFVLELQMNEGEYQLLNLLTIERGVIEIPANRFLIHYTVKDGNPEYAKLFINVSDQYGAELYLHENRKPAGE